MRIKDISIVILEERRDTSINIKKPGEALLLTEKETKIEINEDYKVLEFV